MFYNILFVGATGTNLPSHFVQKIKSVICKVNRESRDVENILSFLSSLFVSRVSRDKRFITENYTSDNIPLYIQHNHLYSVVTTGHRYLVLCRCVDENKIAFHFMEVLQNYRFWSELHFTSLMDSGIFLSSTINHYEIRVFLFSRTLQCG